MALDHDRHVYTYQGVDYMYTNLKLHNDLCSITHKLSKYYLQSGYYNTKISTLPKSILSLIKRLYYKTRIRYYDFKKDYYKKKLLNQSYADIKKVNENPSLFIPLFITTLMSSLSYYKDIPDMEKALNEAFKQRIKTKFQGYITFANNALKQKKYPQNINLIYIDQSKDPRYYQNKVIVTTVNVDATTKLFNGSSISEVVYDTEDRTNISTAKILSNFTINISNDGLIDNPNLVWNKSYRLEEYKKYSRVGIRILSLMYSFINSISLTITPKNK